VNTQPATLSRRRWARSTWRIARPLIVAYLVVVLVMMFLETWLVYPAPPPKSGNWNPTGFRYEDVHFTSADGTKLHGWFIPHPNPTRAILYCHGNGEDVASVGELAAHLSNVLQASVFVFDYRGYGHSEGSPNEAGCIADGDAAQRWLATRMCLRPNDVIVMGRSLGSAVAIALAGQNGTRALVLENAFPTMPDVAAIHFPWLPVRWVMKNRYDNLNRIRRYNGPLLQSHGTADVLIPIGLARSLFDASPSRNKKWLELPNRGHNDPLPFSYYNELAAFLNAVDAASGQKEPPTSSN
jgi:uncharacterized protein